MYPKFIEVTCELGDEEHRTIEKRIINVDHIVAVSENIIHCGKDGTWYADESYDELKELIVDCGCYIKKGDPRLDTENRLTEQMIMDEGMVGEPVWNTNKSRWYIIANWSNLKDDFLVELQGIYDILRYTAEDLKKFPLYRIRKTEAL